MVYAEAFFEMQILSKFDLLGAAFST